MNILKKIIASLMAVSLLSGTLIAFSKEEEVLINVASQAKLESSGYSHQMTVWSLIDGDIQSGWSSNTANNTWFTMDLGRKMVIERIELVTRQDVDQAHTRNNFVVEVSNSPSFSDAVIVGKVGSTAIGHKDTFKAVVQGKYRYVRYRKTSGNYSFLTEARVLVKEKDMPPDGEEKDEIYSKMDLFKVLGADVDGLSENVTRGEAAIVFSKLMKLSGTEEKYYNDIKDEETLNAANALCEANVLSVSSENKYNPQRPISYHQAIKMAVCALGCNIRAEYKGGFPTGYVMCAQELGILSGVSNVDFKKKDFINLLYNMLEANIYEISDISDDGIGYDQSKETFLERYFEMYKKEGIVEENYAFSAYLSKSDIEKNHLFIDGKKFRFTNEEYIDLFGKNVHCYYTDDKSGNYDIVFMYADPDQSKLVLSLADYEKISGNNLEYDEKYYKLDGEYRLIKNGKRISLSSLGTLSKDGIIELYDNDGDNYYEIINIIETTTKIIDKCKESDDKVTLNFKDKSKISVLKEDNIFIKYDNGDYGEINSFSENDIVSYFYSSGTFLAYVGNKIYENKITEITDKEVVIDFVNRYNIAVNAVDIDNKILNKFGTIYFDYMGNVFWYDGTVNIGNGYGYWIGFEPGTGFEDAKMRIFTEHGTFAVYKVTAPLLIDNTQYNTTSAAVSAVENYFNNNIGTDLGILIKYDSTSGMRITFIDTENQGNGGDDDCLNKIYTPSGHKYYSYGVHDDRYVIDEDAVIFRIPKELKDEKNFTISQRSQLKNKTQYSLHGYTHDKTTALPTIHAAVISSAKPGFPERPQIFIIKEISKVFMNDESVPLLKGYSAGEEKKYTMDEEFVEKFGNELSKGDVLQIRVDENDVIVNCRYIYNNADGNTVGNNAAIKAKDSRERILDFDSTYASITGGVDASFQGDSNPTVYRTPLYTSMGVYAQEGDFLHIRKMKKDKDTGELVFEAHEGYLSGKDIIINTSDADVYFVDKTNDTVKIGSINDIISYKEDNNAFSKIILRVHSGEVLEIAVYN